MLVTKNRYKILSNDTTDEEIIAYAKVIHSTLYHLAPANIIRARATTQMYIKNWFAALPEPT